MHYQISVVGEHELPEGCHVVIVERDYNAPPLMLINGPPARMWEMMRTMYDDAAGECCEGEVSVLEPLRLVV